MGYQTLCQINVNMKIAVRLHGRFFVAEVSLRCSAIDRFFIRSSTFHLLVKQEE